MFSSFPMGLKGSSSRSSVFALSPGETVTEASGVLMPGLQPLIFSNPSLELVEGSPL